MSFYPLTGVNTTRPPRVLYHYTSQVGLLGIVSKRQVWATNVVYMNDSSEYRHGLEVIEQAVSAGRKSCGKAEIKFFRELDEQPALYDESHFFIASLTEQGDLLSQWRGYSPNGSGFSVGFDSSALEALATGTPRASFELLKCVYSEARQVELATALLETCRKAWLSREVRMRKEPARKPAKSGKMPIRIYPPAMFRLGASFLAPVLKSSGFSEEQEWRLVGTCRLPELMRFRAGVSMITPYLEVNVAGSDKKSKAGPIVSVTIGPCPNPALARRSVEWLLQAEGVGGSRVENSTVPYRGW